jgi:hypothetical protein
LRLYRNKRGDYVVYDKAGKVVIITHHKRHAVEYARSVEDGGKKVRRPK